ncbi:hypothetical protein H6F95_31875 [Cyanobacteria bacterium FACHB-471]|nr:hypothetical protein [Cyanobacteria bacterium FACHB-471]
MPSTKRTIHVPHKLPCGYRAEPLDFDWIFDRKPKKDEVLQELQAARKQIQELREQESKFRAALARVLKTTNLAPKTERSEVAKELLVALIEFPCETGSIDRFLDSLMQLN